MLHHSGCNIEAQRRQIGFIKALFAPSFAFTLWLRSLGLQPTGGLSASLPARRFKVFLCVSMTFSAASFGKLLSFLISKTEMWQQNSKSLSCLAHKTNSSLNSFHHIKDLGGISIKFMFKVKLFIFERDSLYR